MEVIKTPAQTIQPLPKSLQFIVRSLEREMVLKPAQVIRIVKSADVKPKDLRPWADFDHPASDSYGRHLVYKGKYFEIMVMSWRPGDFSTIHDHGHTQWGAVQIFGPAEQATFRQEDDYITTLARWTVASGEVIGVGHSLIHQMGNPTSDVFFLSLHVYGDLAPQDNVTGNARIFDLESNKIRRVDGGVFFALPEALVKSTEAGPAGDFPTRLRHMIELIRRLRKMVHADIRFSRDDLRTIIEDTFSTGHQAKLMQCLDEHTDDAGHQTDSIYWRVLNRELREAARLQNTLLGERQSIDQFHKYAQLYDALIGLPSMDTFMRRYLLFFAEKYQVDFPVTTVISVGCGTGLAEEFMIKELHVPYNNMYGIDISESMIEEASKRIRADVGDVLTLDPGIRMWDMAFSGLNVFQYLPHTRLQEAIEKTAAIINPSGYFIGDFITPDHIRWYPNVVCSTDRNVISLRTPELIEENGSMFQQSEIINVSFQDLQMRVTYAGRHRRFLPPMHRVRQYFEQAFRGDVRLYDALNLELIPESADSCPSTRYVVVAQKGAD